MRILRTAVLLVCLAAVSLVLAACGSDEAKVAVPVALDVDTVTAGPGEGAVDADAVCVQRNVFQRGMRVVFRMSAQDTVTGKALGDAEVTEAVLSLATGEKLPFSYGPHGEGEGKTFWTTAWDIAKDYPLGTVDYKITLTTVNGDTVTWTQPRPVPPTLLQIAA